MGMLSDFITKHKLHKSFSEIAQKHYVPLAEQLKKHHDGANSTFYVGINGSQGSGKSTLAEFLKEYLQDKYPLSVVALSLDDFYLSQSQRLAMSVKIHPLFKTRGVPGTHNIQEIEQVLTSLALPNKSIAIPRFDKSTDNPFPRNEWPTVRSPVDIVIFEGWCWGVNAQVESKLSCALNELEKNQDELGVWRNFVNRQLKQYYQPLYQIMDYWIMLKAPSFEYVYEWRLEQEQKLSADVGSKPADGLMSPAQIRSFILYYQRLTEHALVSLPALCDQVFTLNRQRGIASIDETKND
jgi:D-glycerate 3-kinase